MNPAFLAIWVVVIAVCISTEFNPGDYKAEKRVNQFFFIVLGIVASLGLCLIDLFVRLAKI